MKAQRIDGLNNQVVTPAIGDGAPATKATQKTTQAVAPVARPDTKARALVTGEAPPARGELAMTDPRAQAAIDTSLEALSGRGLGGAQYKASRVEVDELGMAHVHFDRMHNGVKVFAEQAITHMRNGPNGEVTDVTNFNVAIAQSVTTKSAMSKQDAIAIAKKSFDPEGKTPAQRTEVERTCFAAGDGTYRMGFCVQMADKKNVPPRAMFYLIDGSSKEIVRQWNSLCSGFSRLNARPAAPKPVDGGNASDSPSPTSTPEAGANATANTSNYGKEPMTDTTRADGKHVVWDKSRLGGIHVLDGKNGEDGGPTEEVVDNDGHWGESGDSPRQVGAIGLEFCMEVGADFLKSLGINGWDLKGGEVEAVAHIFQNYVNAYYERDTKKNQVRFVCGDGNGTDAGPLGEDMTVPNHELGHGLDDFMTDGGLTYSDESGGLNEAYADILAHLVLKFTATATGPDGTSKYPQVAALYAGKKPTMNIWNIGEACWTPGAPGDALRYMQNPAQDGYSIDNYKQYPGHDEVHQSSGIANNMFYQLAETNNEGKIPNATSGHVVKDGIGEEKAGKIYLRQLQHYATKDTTLSEARVAWIKAATDLYGANSVEVQKVKEAWTAVGVEDPAVATV